MTDCRIEECIIRELCSNEKETALAFVAFLREQNLVFHKDQGAYWKDKNYYWVKQNDECVCYIAVRNPDEPENRWTVWSADMESEWLENYPVNDGIRETAWKCIDCCAHCGSCSGGRRKVVFGRVFDEVCGCTFRIDNPKTEMDLTFLKTMQDAASEYLKDTAIWAATE